MAAIFQEGEKLDGEWKKARAEYDETDNHLVILGKPVMERWETPFMHKMADIVTSNGGRVLEMGFGMGISGSRIQTAPNITEHVIIEMNDDVFKRLLQFSANSKSKVTPLNGKWQDVVPSLEDASFDGILYDTYPFDQRELHSHQFDFIAKQGFRLLKPGGILTYCNITSYGVLLKEQFNYDVRKMFEENQIPQLEKIGFKKENISYEVVEVMPESGCRYYDHNELIAPRLVKQ
jgi:guanidinoacetate N-methyltransferase